MRFRAVTLHVRSEEEYESYSDLLDRLHRRLDAFTKRVVMTEPLDVKEELKAVHAGLDPEGFDRAYELLKEGYFTSVNMGDRSYGANLLYAAEFLHRISEELGPEANTMFALTSGEPYETPYFPATRGGSFGISASLLYPSELYGALYEAEEPEMTLRSVLKFLFSQAEQELLDELGDEAPFLGIDYSLSPWMEESSARVISLLARTDFLEPGTASAILEMNEIIRESVEGLKSMGFNEVMLPMAEDSLLMDMALQDKLRARDLAYLSSYCVTGLDMVVIPFGDVSRLAKMIGDVLSSGRVKGKVVGIRIIPVDEEPGEKIRLGRFGEVPVMEL